VLRNQKGNRALISSIILQAVTDALSDVKDRDHHNAMQFLKCDNELFIYYCTLLKINPDYAAEKIQNALKKDKLGLSKNLKR